MLIIGLILIILSTSIWSTSSIINENNKHDKIFDFLFIYRKYHQTGQLFTRITVILLTYCLYLSYNNMYYMNTVYNKDTIGIYNGLFQVSLLNIAFEMIIILLGIIILFITSYKACISSYEKIIAYLNKDEKTYEIENYTSSSYLYNKRIWHNYVGNKSYDQQPSYPLIIIFNLIGALLLMKSYDIISMYICIELQSFALYILATINRNDTFSVKAGLKYFLLGGLSSCFILLGSSLLYFYTGQTNFEYIYILYTLNENNPLSINSIDNFTFIQKYENFLSFDLAIILLLCGFLFKIAAAPFHNWAMDVYDIVPHIITTWLTVMTKISILIFLLILVYHLSIKSNTLPLYVEYSSFYNNSKLLNESLLSYFNNYKTSNEFSFNQKYEIKYINYYNLILLICAFWSLIVGTIVGLVQSRIKRLLAYSTVSHVGFLLLCLLCISDNSSFNYLDIIYNNIIDENKNLIFNEYVNNNNYIKGNYSNNVESFLFYLIQYSLTNANNFFILLAFGYIISRIEWSSYTYINYIKKDYIDEKKHSNNISNYIIDNNNVNNDVYNRVIYLDDLKGSYLYNPILSLCFIISLFSLAGIPPQIGFFAKQMVLLSAIQSGYITLSVVAILVSVISACYYLRIIKILYFDKNLYDVDDLVKPIEYILPLKNNENSITSDNIKNTSLSYNKNSILSNINYMQSSPKEKEWLNSILCFNISILSIITLFFWLYPSILLNWVHILTLSIYYT